MSSRVLALIAGAALAACGSSDDDDGSVQIDAPAATDGPPVARETVTRTITLDSGDSSEGELELVAAGDKIHVRVEASAATLAWNVHTHGSSGTITLEEGNAVDTIDYEITGEPGDYSFLVINGGATMTFDVNLDLYGQAAYRSGL